MFVSTHGITARPTSSAYGTLTTAWIAATGETDLTILGALNTLESDLTTYGLTSKITALYPFVGGTASKHSYNFMNTAAHQITFSGGWTHSSNGALSNGTNAYADTNLSPNSILLKNNNHHASYIRNLPSQSIAYQGVGTPNWFISGKVFSGLEYFANATSFLASGTSVNLQGMLTFTRRGASDIEMYKNGTSIVSGTTVSQNLPSNNFWLGGVNDGGSLNSPLGAQYAFFSLGDGLTDTRAANFYTAVQTFQTTLGRSIGTQTVSDADAQAFVTAASITDQVQATAVNNLVIGLKADGLWTKMAAIYPFVGGTAASHKFNLKNPLDTDAAYRLVFNGGWTHSSTGALPNGTNAFADTKLNASTVLASFNSNHISYYSRTQNLTDSANMGGGSGSAYLTLERSTQWNGNTFLNFAVDPTTSLFINTRTANNVQKLYRNGSQLGSTNTATSTISANAALYLGARNIGGGNQYSVRECALASIGDGLSDAESANLYTRVQTYQTALSRNV